MSTIKSDSIQPTLGTNNLILKTGSADTERIRITPSGVMTVSSTVSSTFSGSLTVSGAANMNGRLGIGAALSGTPNSQLEVVGSGYGSPQFNTVNTTRSRAAAEFGSIVTNTRLFVGTVDNEQAAWLQVQNTGNNLAYSLSLQAAGGGVAIGATTSIAPLHVYGGPRYAQAEIRLTDEYVNGADWGILAQTGNSLKMFRILDRRLGSHPSTYVDRFVINAAGHLACGFTSGVSPQDYINYAGSNNYATVFSIVGKDSNGTLSGGIGDGRLELQNPVISSAVTTSTTFGRVMFVNSGQAGTNSVKAQIDCVASSAGANKGGIISFSTNPGGSSSSGLVRAVEINEIGTLIAYGSTSPAFTVNSQVAGTAATSAVTWLRNGAACGHINFTGSTVAFTNSSDYRLKKDVLSITNGLESVCRLNPVSFKWTRGDIDDIGFIAHEVQNVVPLAAFGEKDAVNEDGSVKPQQIVMDKLVPVLVAAVKELKGIVDAQAAEIAELKAK